MEADARSSEVKTVNEVRMTSGAVAAPHNRWDRILWATTLAGLALLAVAVGREWNAAREATVPVFANPRIAITDTADASLPIAVAASHLE